MTPTPDRTSDYKANSLSLGGAIAMGTGVMIGAGIFALTGQIAELAGLPAVAARAPCPPVMTEGDCI